MEAVLERFVRLQYQENLDNHVYFVYSWFIISAPDVNSHHARRGSREENISDTESISDHYNLVIDNRSQVREPNGTCYRNGVPTAQLG